MDARKDWTSLRQELDAAAAGTKDSQSVVIKLSREYAVLSTDERESVDQVISEWVLSDDPKLRFDAMALIGDQHIQSATPALRRLAERLEDAPGPSAPYEWAKVNRLLGQLTRDA